MAQSQHNIQTLKLVINTNVGPAYDEGVAVHQVEKHATFSAALQSFRLVLVQIHYEPQLGVIDDNVLPSMTGLGVPNLKNIDVRLIQPEKGLTREQVPWRRWVKLPNGDWQME
jgi:hypothetical protein